MAIVDDKVLKDAQYRKGLSIAFFNATNAAIELTKGYKFATEEEQRKAIVETRNWLLTEHQTYYATVLSAVGDNFNPADAIEKLKGAQNYEELSMVWRLLSEDERRHAEIIKTAKEVKARFQGTADEGAQAEAPADVPTVQVDEPAAEAPAQESLLPEGETPAAPVTPKKAKKKQDEAA